KAAGESASSTPPEVATPLPPRKPANTVNMCPSTLAAATESLHHSGPPGNAAHAASPGTNHVGSAPFATSRSSTGTPTAGPSVRQTLVARGFSERSVRTSTPRIARPSHRPQGSDPARYPRPSAVSRAGTMRSTLLLALLDAKPQRRALEAEVVRELRPQVAAV